MDPYRIQTLDELRELVGDPNKLTPAKLFEELDDMTIAFIARSPFVVLSTAGADGNQDVSPKGDPPGFVLVEDPRTIVIPDRTGNKLLMGHQNILENPQRIRWRFDSQIFYHFVIPDFRQIIDGHRPVE